MEQHNHSHTDRLEDSTAINPDNNSEEEETYLYVEPNTSQLSDNILLEIARTAVQPGTGDEVILTITDTTDHSGPGDQTSQVTTTTSDHCVAGSSVITHTTDQSVVGSSVILDAADQSGSGYQTMQIATATTDQSVAGLSTITHTTDHSASRSLETGGNTTTTKQSISSDPDRMYTKKQSAAGSSVITNTTDQVVRSLETGGNATSRKQSVSSAPDHMYARNHSVAGSRYTGGNKARKQSGSGDQKPQGQADSHTEGTTTGQLPSSDPEMDPELTVQAVLDDTCTELANTTDSIENDKNRVNHSESQNSDDESQGAHTARPEVSQQPDAPKQAKTVSISDSDLAKYTVFYGKKQLFFCKTCSLMFVEKSDLANHLATHPDKQRQTHKRKLRSSNRKADSKRKAKKELSCKECDYRTTSRTKIIAHATKTHSVSHPYLCDHCNYSAVTKKAMDKHMLGHTQEGPFACEECNFTTSEIAYMKKHIENHASQVGKPYKCDQCGFTAAKRKTLEAHKLTWCVPRATPVKKRKKATISGKPSNEEGDAEPSTEVTAVTNKSVDADNKPVAVERALRRSVRIPSTHPTPAVEERPQVSTEKTAVFGKPPNEEETATSMEPYPESDSDEGEGGFDLPEIQSPSPLHSDEPTSLALGKSSSEGKVYPSAELAQKSAGHTDEFVLPGKESSESQMFQPSDEKATTSNMAKQSENRDTEPFAELTPTSNGHRDERCCVPPERGSSEIQHVYHSAATSFSKASSAEAMEVEASTALLPKSDRDANERSHTATANGSLETPPQHLEENFAICEDRLLETVDQSSDEEHEGIANEAAEEVYRCGQCDFSADTQGELDHHVEEHKQKFRCDQCGFTTSSRKKLAPHFKVHKKRPYRCPECDFVTNVEKLLAKHMRVHESVLEEQTFRCDECGFTATSRRKLGAHRRVHTYKCGECDFTTRKQNLLDKHTSKHISDKKLHCDECGFSTRSKRQLEKHCNQHKMSKKKTDKRKKSTAKTQTGRNKHTAKRTSKETFVCDKCGFTTSSKQQLTSHCTVHTTSKDRPYKCKECNFTAKTQRQLSKHTAKHTPDNKLETHCRTHGTRSQDLPETGGNKATEQLRSTDQVESQPRPSDQMAQVTMETTDHSGTVSQETSKDKTVQLGSGDLAAKPLEQPDCEITATGQWPSTVPETEIAVQTVLEDTELVNTNNSIEDDEEAVQEQPGLHTESKATGHLGSTDPETLLAVWSVLEVSEIAYASNNIQKDQEAVQHHGTNPLANPDSHTESTATGHLGSTDPETQLAVQSVLEDTEIANTSNSIEKDGETVHQAESPSPESQAAQENFSCEECGFATSSKNQLETHCKTHTTSKKKPYKCKECDYTSPIPSVMKKHEAIHNGGPFVCDKCEFSTSSRLAFTSHCRHHTKGYKQTCEETVTCDECGFTTNIVRRMEAHCKTHTSVRVRPFKCSECNYAATFKVALTKHMLTQHTKKRPDAHAHVCDICGYTAPRRDYLVDHRRKHTGEKPYKCSECGFAASRKSNLNQHMARCKSNWEKQFMCDVCGKTLTSQKNLEMHIACHHSNDKAHLCEYCGLKTGSMNSLNAHRRRIHTGSKPRQKPFKCDQCDYGTESRRNLKHHKMKHTGEKPFACTMCDYKTAHDYHLKRHMEIHSGIYIKWTNSKPSVRPKNYECSECGGRWNFKSRYLSHMKKFHEDV